MAVRFDDTRRQSPDDNLSATEPSSERELSEHRAEPDRQWLLHQLQEVLEIAMERISNPKTPAPDRIKWSRVVIAAGQACNSVLRDAEIDDLKQQIEELKKLTLAKLSDEQESNQEGDTEPSANN
jgi:hypothetical protein